MAGFTDTVSSPGAVSGSTPVHESMGSVIGGALTGAAKLLDVGLKADHEDRMNKLDVEIGDRLSDVTKAMSAPKDNAGIFVQGDLQPWEKAQGLDKIGNLAQAHFHSPDKVSFAQMMGKAGSITQEIIHAHPRYADEIRARVQKILGVNPNEEAIKQTLDDEQALKRAKLDIKVRGAQEAAAAGYPMQLNEDGSPDWDSGYKSYAIHKRAEADSEMLSKSLMQERERLEIAKLQNPQAKPETEDQRQTRIQSGIMAVTDGPFNEVMNTNINSLIRVMGDLGKLNMDEAVPGSQVIAGSINTLREQAIQGVAVAKTSVARIVNNLRERAMANGAESKVEDWDKVLANYNSQLAEYHNLFVTAPSEVIESRIKGVQGLQAQIKTDFLQANHTLAVLQAFLGENNPALASMFGDAIIRNPEVNTAMKEAATAALGTATAGPTPPGSKAGYRPAVPAQENPVGALHRTLGNVVGVVTGAIQAIPDKTTARVLEGQMMYFGKNADHLSPNEQMRYGQVADAIVRTGLQYTDVNQLGGALNATSSPAQLRAFDGYAKVHPDQGQKLGESLVKLNRLYAQRTINSGVLQPTTGGTNLTFSPVYNPSAGRVEIRVTDQHGTVVNPDARYSPTPQYNGLPAAMSMQVNLLNQALAASTHLKKYGDNTSWQDLQIKQGMAAGLPLRPGSEPVPMPGEEHKTSKVPEKKPAAKKVSVESDPLGLLP